MTALFPTMSAVENPSAETGGFLTEVVVDPKTAPTADHTLLPAPAKPEPTVVLAPLVSVYRVEDAELPLKLGEEQFSPLPTNIHLEKVMSNIVNNLDIKTWSDKARATWTRDFKSLPSRAVISDTFWYCICWYFKPGQHSDLEQGLLDRISANFVALFNSVTHSRKDYFFRFYADAVAQAVLYSMFLAYPKSRVYFTEKFRKILIIRVAYWTTGICPEFVDTSHWKLNLGGGDVLQSTTSQARPSQGGKPGQPLVAAPAGAGGGGGDAQRQRSLAHRAPRPLKTLRYSPLVRRYLQSRKYSSVNLVRATRMSMTTAEERARLMDVKAAEISHRAHASRMRAEAACAEYEELCADVRRQEHQRQKQVKRANKQLEIRRKEVLRSDPHEYANYLVSLHLLQQGMGQSA